MEVLKCYLPWDIVQSSENSNSKTVIAGLLSDEVTKKLGHKYVNHTWFTYFAGYISVNFKVFQVFYNVNHDKRITIFPNGRRLSTDQNGYVSV